jgi:hypothetical protein
LYGVGVAVTQGAVLPALIPRIGEYRTLIFGVVAGIFALVALGMTPPPMLVFVLIPIACLSDMVPPTATAMMSNMVAEDRQGVLQGVIASLGSIAAVIAPLIVTPLFHAFAAPDAPLYLPGMPFLAAGALLIWCSRPSCGSTRPGGADARAGAPDSVPCTGRGNGASSAPTGQERRGRADVADQNPPVGDRPGLAVLFSDFEHNGEMWAGEGEREVRVWVAFSEPFLNPPAIHRRAVDVGHGPFHQPADGHLCRGRDGGGVSPGVSHLGRHPCRAGARRLDRHRRGDA